MSCMRYSGNGCSMRAPWPFSTHYAVWDPGWRSPWRLRKPWILSGRAVVEAWSQEPDEEITRKEEL